MFSLLRWWSGIAVLFTIQHHNAAASCTMEPRTDIAGLDSEAKDYGPKSSQDCDDVCLSKPECVAVRLAGVICLVWEDEAHLSTDGVSPINVKVCQTTASPTTEAPTTQPPTTQPPTTQAPTTQPPTTQPPTACTMEPRTDIGGLDSEAKSYGPQTSENCDFLCLSNSECVAIRLAGVCFYWVDEAHLSADGVSPINVKVCQTTASPTTEAPTTQPPTTQQPTTPPPTTQPETTQPPTNQPPTTQPPTTQPPTTQPPTTQPETTQPETTQPPTTETPTTQPSNQQTDAARSDISTTERISSFSSGTTTREIITLASISGCVSLIVLVPLIFLTCKIRTKASRSKGKSQSKRRPPKKRSPNTASFMMKNEYYRGNLAISPYPYSTQGHFAPNRPPTRYAIEHTNNQNNAPHRSESVHKSSHSSHDGLHPRNSTNTPYDTF